MFFVFLNKSYYQNKVVFLVLLFLVTGENFYIKCIKQVKLNSILKLTDLIIIFVFNLKTIAFACMFHQFKCFGLLNTFWWGFYIEFSSKNLDRRTLKPTALTSHENLYMFFNSHWFETNQKIIREPYILGYVSFLIYRK